MKLLRKNNTSGNSILEGVIWKQILIFFLPILIGSFFQQLYNTVDAIVIGQAVGTNALAAIGSTGSLTQLLIGFFIGVASGATVVLAQYYGSADQERVSKTVHTAMALSFWISLLLTVFGIITAKPLLRLMSVPKEIIEDATLYMQVYYAGMLGNIVYNIGTGLLRAVGDSKRPLYVLICSALINVVLDLLFVLVFHWGVFGAALATIIAQIVSAVIIVILLMRTEDMYRLYLRKIRIDFTILKEVVRIGIPSGLESVVYSFSNVLIQACINSFGTTCIAAWSAIGKIDGCVWMVMQAYGISVTTFVGQNFGAKKYDRVKKCGRVGMWMNMGSIFVVSLLMFAFSPFLLEIFTGDADVVAMGTLLIRTIAPAYLFYVFISIYSAAPRGAGEALQPALLSVFGICGLRLLWLLFVVPLHHTPQMVVLCYDVSWAVTGLVYFIYYHRFGWLDRCKKRQSLQG